MSLETALRRLFHQLDELLEQLSPEEYRQPIELLSGATVGQHYRHIIECLQELEKGYASGVVNYDLRQRQRLLETDPELARQQLRRAGDALGRPDKTLVVEGAVDGGAPVCLGTSYHRELYHNLDHTVHHMAIIRAGLLAMGGIVVPEDFGVAAATLKFRAGRMKHFLFLAILFVFGAPGVSAQSCNLNSSGVAVGGYDPVAYFTTSKAVEGKKEFSYAIDGATYRFVSAADRDLFKATPVRYQPQYGGWCAYAMGANGQKVEVDPETFKIIDGKLYLFYNKFFNNTLKSWNKDEAHLKASADANWMKQNTK